jgi:hypothetical protein
MATGDRTRSRTQCLARRNKRRPSSRKGTDKTEQKGKPMRNSRSITRVPKDARGSRWNLKIQLGAISSTNAKRKRNCWSATYNSDTSNKRVRSRSGPKLSQGLRSALSRQKEQKSGTRILCSTSKGTKCNATIVPLSRSRAKATLQITNKNRRGESKEIGRKNRECQRLTKSGRK